MNKLYTLCSSLVIASAVALAPVSANTQENKLEPYHTHNQTYYQDNKVIDKYLGDLVSMKGKVLKIEKGLENRVIFQLKLDDLDKTLWVATIMNVLENAINVGDNARVLGFLDETKLEPEYVAKLSNDKEYLLGFCFHMDNNGLPIYFNRFMARCIQWENGEPFQEETKVVNKQPQSPSTNEHSQPKVPKDKK